ncbi:MAG TPA: YfiR family protein [Vicinamibacterales bacterium]|nr:YfiR family protein [Vicinamibacterales bacterium]
MRRIISVAAIVLLGAGVAPVRAQTLEDEVKAAFLYNFAKFVEWPADAFDSADAPITFCLVGRDRFGSALDDVIRGERIRNRPLAVRRFEDVGEARGCHLLFVSPDLENHFAALLRAVDTTRVLTVSDSLAFLKAGGHISFFVEASRVRFAVNQEACDRASFRVSSKLLQVARQPGGAQAP